MWRSRCLKNQSAFGPSFQRRFRTRSTNSGDHWKLCLFSSRVRVSKLFLRMSSATKESDGGGEFLVACVSEACLGARIEYGHRKNLNNVVVETRFGLRK